MRFVTGVGLLDHTDVVSAIADGRGSFAGVLLNQLNDLRFLRGRASAADDSRRSGRQFQKFLLVVSEADVEAFPADD